jgi:hypothetical protein
MTLPESSVPAPLKLQKCSQSQKYQELIVKEVKVHEISGQEVTVLDLSVGDLLVQKLANSKVLVVQEVLVQELTIHDLSVQELTDGPGSVGSDVEISFPTAFYFSLFRKWEPYRLL